jgi:hypothetical protein
MQPCGLVVVLQEAQPVAVPDGIEVGGVVFVGQDIDVGAFGNDVFDVIEDDLGVQAGVGVLEVACVCVWKKGKEKEREDEYMNI